MRCSQGRLHKSSLDGDFAVSKIVSIFTFPHCGPLYVCENNFSFHQLEVWL